jgi:AAA15 family ATPase/GTPase
MLDSLHIQNYRLFKDLKIDKLGQVNLIAGKNNTGKTALLEALRICKSKGNATVINNIIYQRGDLNRGNDLETYKTLFYKNDISREIQINVNRSFYLSLKQNDYSDRLFKKPFIVSILSESDYIELDSERVFDNPQDEAIFTSIDIENKNNLKYWNEISLTPLEETIVSVLQIIDKRISKVRLDNGVSKVLLKDEKTPIPLKNLGDGVNRLFTIALALVNAENNYFLLDEFEVGLHHSVQKQLWEIIFKYAKEWSIQVFVTTHSQDTIENFYYVANKYDDMGKYFILSKVNDNIEAVNYDLKEMKLALETNLELR